MGGRLNFAAFFIPMNPNAELLTLYCTSYGAVITYFFTHKKSGENVKEDENGTD